MKAAKVVLAGILILALLVSPALLIFWPQIQGWLAFNAAARTIESLDPSDQKPRQFSFDVNTFQHEVPSQTIKDYYNRAADLLAAKSGNVRTYVWRSDLGSESISTVLQYPDWHVEVRASCTNDSDSFLMWTAPGTFSRPEASTLPNHALPHGILRCDLKTPG